jgi:oxygen-independent coproporphyrinogen-3 oxidase
VERLIEEIQDYQYTKFAQETVETIYFGGGTPSLLAPKQVRRILNALDATFDIEAREVTFEMNPDDVTKEYLAALKSLGITRVSMGVQSFQPDLLDLMNRAHSNDEAEKCLDLLSQSRFESFTVDLIYGNPNQSMAQLEDDLDKLLSYNPPHVSAYSLTVEPKTKLSKMIDLGRIDPPDDDRVSDQFDVVNKRLQAQGIERYEVSNYSHPGREAIHNSRYWEHQNYLGFGPAAHSFWWDEDGAARWDNERNLRNYLHRKNEHETEQLSDAQLAEERLMMGLRTRNGVKISELNDRYQYNLNERQTTYLQSLQQEDKVALDDCIKLTDKGIKIADAIILDLVTLH